MIFLKKLLNRSKNIGNDFLDKIFENHVWAYASSAAFYFFLSMVPMLLMLLGMLPYTGISMESLKELLMGVVPGALSGFIDGMLTELYGKNGIHPTFTLAMIIPFLTTWWSASLGLAALANGFNIIYDTNRKPGFKVYIRFRIKCLFCTFIFMAFMIAWMFIVAASKEALQVLEQYVPFFTGWIGILFEKRALVGILIMTLVFEGLYILLPDRRIKGRIKLSEVGTLILSQLPGAVVAANCWTVFAILLSVCISAFGMYSMYGSFATMVIFMVWIFSGMLIIMIGAQMNHYSRHFWGWCMSGNGSVKALFRETGKQVRLNGQMKKDVCFRGTVCCVGREVLWEDKIKEYPADKKLIAVYETFSSENFDDLKECIGSYPAGIIIGECADSAQMTAEELSNQFIDFARRLDIPVLWEVRISESDYENLDNCDAVFDGRKGSLIVKLYPWTKRNYSKLYDMV